MSPVVVSVVVPTYNRHDRLAALYETFASQTLAQSGAADLHVLDDSETPCPFFSSLQDPRVHYRHVGERMSIGAKRNALVQGASGEFIESFDDDDLYAPMYLERKLARMRSTGADLLKLSVWNAICERDGSVWQWDTRTIGPEHYAVTGGADPEKIPAESMGEPSPELLDSQLWGYGFSYGYRRSAWERAPFKDMNLGEDYIFICDLRAAGAKLVHVPDMASSVLHTVHPKSTSVILPQRRLASATLGAMLTPLPAGDVHVEPGVTYAIVALVKDSNSLKDVMAKVQSRGMNVLSAKDGAPAPAGEKAAPGGYRYVSAEFTVEKSGKIPGSVPWPLSHLDKTRIVRAWSDKPQVNGQLTPAAAGAAGMPLFRASNDRCGVCRHYAWHDQQRPTRGLGGLHHPACRMIGQRQLNAQLSPG